jgi:hypothetical protein
MRHGPRVAAAACNDSAAPLIAQVAKDNARDEDGGKLVLQNDDAACARRRRPVGGVKVWRRWCGARAQARS